MREIDDLQPRIKNKESSNKKVNLSLNDKECGEIFQI